MNVDKCIILDMLLQNSRTVSVSTCLLDDYFRSGEKAQQSSEHSAQDLGQAVD